MRELLKQINSEIQFIENYKGVELYIKREDLIHPQISGNKWRKLKYNLIEAREKGFETILTFGGAYSNHIAATAAACNQFGFKSIGVIRGDEHSELNPTLKLAHQNNMKLHYVSRSDYKLKQQDGFLNKLKSEFGSFYLIPEGGDNNLGIKGCEEILNIEDAKFDIVSCAIGTGSTFIGLINGSDENQTCHGFSVLKLGDSIIKKLNEQTSRKNWKVFDEFHFGGYAKINQDLISFINSFYIKHGIPLDPIYTGKMVFGVYNLINNNRINRGEKVLLIHTGGLQGAKGIEKRYDVKFSFSVN